MDDSSGKEKLLQFLENLTDEQCKVLIKHKKEITEAISNIND